MAVKFGATPNSPTRSSTHAPTSSRIDLRANGARDGDCVAIYLERSLDLPLAILAVLKAGCVYIPLDPIYPDERVNFILDQADVRLLLTQTALAVRDTVIFGRDASSSTLKPTISPRSRRQSAARPPISAYIIYTSGSTGRPKGVEVTHRSFVNLLLSMAARAKPRLHRRAARAHHDCLRHRWPRVDAPAAQSAPA